MFQRIYAGQSRPTHCTVDSGAAPPSSVANGTNLPLVGRSKDVFASRTYQRRSGFGKVLLKLNVAVAVANANEAVHGFGPRRIGRKRLGSPDRG